MSRPLTILLLRYWLIFLVLYCSIAFLASLLLFAASSVSLYHRRMSVTLIVWLPLLLAMVAIFKGRMISGKWRPNVWIWRLSRRIVGYRTVSNGRISILFPPGLEESTDVDQIMRWSEADLDEFSDWFRMRMRRRLTIVLVPSYRDLTADFARLMGGVALPPANAVILARDCPLRGLLRHELVHLFAARWNTLPLPLLQEGLADWLETSGTEQRHSSQSGRLIDRFGANPTRLLDHRYFFDDSRVEDSYASSGVFTGFLIRRFGLDRYRRLYRWSMRWNFLFVFRKLYGMTLEKAWRDCGEQASVMAILDRRSEKDSLFGFRL